MALVAGGRWARIKASKVWNPGFPLEKHVLQGALPSRTHAHTGVSCTSDAKRRALMVQHPVCGLVPMRLIGRARNLLMADRYKGVADAAIQLPAAAVSPRQCAAAESPASQAPLRKQQLQWRPSTWWTSSASGLRVSTWHSPPSAPDTGALVTPACASLSSLLNLTWSPLHAPVQRRTVSGSPASTRCGASSRCSPRRTLTSRPRQVETATCCKGMPLTTCVAAAVKAHVGVGKGASSPRKP